MSSFQFPLGIIGKVQDIINDEYLENAVVNHTLKRNIAYTFQFTHLIEWLLDDTDLSLTVQEQVIKFGIIALNSIMEGVVRDYLERPPKIKPAKKMRKNIKKLRKPTCGPVPLRITKQLELAHRRRERIHLHLCRDELEYKKYKKGDYYKTKDAIMSLINWIAE